MYLLTLVIRKTAFNYLLYVSHRSCMYTTLALLFLYVLGRKKVHYVLPDGKEMVEEYDMQNGKLLGMLCTYVHCIADTPAKQVAGCRGVCSPVHGTALK